jgi:hypothetical protein
METTRVVAAGSITSFVTKNTSLHALEEARRMMYRFFNSANVAVHQGTSPEFHSLLTSCLNNAAFLKSQKQNLKIGAQRYRATLMKSVSQTIYVVSSCIEKTYQWYKAATGSVRKMYHF